MIYTNLRCVALWVLGPALCFGMAGSPAFAQANRSPSEIRRENEQLKEQITDLTSKLEAAQRRISRLEDIVRSLQRRNRNAGTPSSGGNDSASDDVKQVLPADQFAAPDAMLAHLKREYEASIGKLPRGTEAEESRYLREIRRWIRQVSARERKQVDWRVRVVKMMEEERGRTETFFEVIDSETDKAIGSAFSLVLVRRDVAKITGAPEDQLWKMTGVFIAEPVQNDERTEPGLYDTPPLIGPFVEFGYEFSLQSISPMAKTQD